MGRSLTHSLLAEKKTGRNPCAKAKDQRRQIARNERNKKIALGLLT